MDAVERIRAAAMTSIGRACSFGGLAVGAAMSGFITWPVMAFKLGALGATLTAVILVLKALNAPRRNYRATELWVLIGRDHRLAEEHAQSIIGRILGETYWRFADYACGTAFVFWLTALMFLSLIHI